MQIENPSYENLNRQLVHISPNMLFGLSLVESFVGMLSNERQVIHAERFGNFDNEDE